ncbi:MAG: N-6 DNA methylase [Pseudomonadota bacterium]
MLTTKKKTPALTTSQQLASILKSARDIMRKDKGLSGDADRIPMLTWIMFLKFLDDLEQVSETSATLKGKAFRPTIEKPYRWRDWAATEGGITGSELIAFVNQEETVRPNGTKGFGLFAYLRTLQGDSGGGDRRDVIASVFRGIQNRMLNGYLLRDVIDKVNGIHFNASEEIHTLSRFYEAMLKEMRDAAGDSGEFYTPRPVVRFMVEAIDPRIGEIVLDPACGTGGFLVEAFTHLEKQCKTVRHRDILQSNSVFGGEPKPLPFLLAQMNLLLHGLERPQIDSGNSLRFPLREIGDKDRVDVILTNPPFGGQEERGIQGNFPEDKRTAETALLFLQLIMRRLKRKPKAGRAAVVVPNGTLSSPGVAMRIRQELLEDFTLKAVVRLPHNVFAPYTDIKTNILFFQRGGPTEQVLFCEPQLAEGVTLSKTNPFLYEWLSPYLECVKTGTIPESPELAESCWMVLRSELDETLNLDLKNPRMVLAKHQAADGRLSALSLSFGRLASETESLRSDVAEITELLRNAPLKKLGTLTMECDERVGADYTKDTRLLGVSTAEGFCDPKGAIGKQPSRYKLVRHGYLAYNPMRINIGSIGVASTPGSTGITSPDYVVFRCLSGLVPEYVYHYLRSEAGRHEINQKTKGSVRFRLYYDKLADIAVPVPDDEKVQQRFAALCQRIEAARLHTLRLADQAGEALDAIRREAFLPEHV